MATRHWLAVASALLLGPACAHRGAGTAAPALAEAKARLMRADYRADLAELARVRDSVLPGLEAPPGTAHLAAYWAGFASWRIALNGINRGLPTPEVRASLERALADLEGSARLEDRFADGHAAAASVAGWLAGFRQDDPPVARGLIERFQRHLARALALEPENPRVLWVEAAPYLFLPEGRGGDRPRAIRLYRQMAQATAPEVPGSPLPDWGRPEAHMSLAFSQLQLADPDLELAEREAMEALRLQPEWHYVKAVLLPQITRAREAARQPGPPSTP